MLSWLSESKRFPTPDINERRDITKFIFVKLLKKGNVERQFRAVHKKYDTDFPPKSELRRRKLRELKSQLNGQQSFFTQRNSKATADTEASLWVSHSIM